jgi:Ser/Thr protein kinase RdoA (MazF antagonist)
MGEPDDQPVEQPPAAVPPAPAAGATPAAAGPHSRITAGELALVCANYDIGEVVSARKLKRGSGSSPKVLIEAATGLYLLKRRAPGRDAPNMVAITHEVQLYLSRRGFPVPEIVGTRRDNNSMLQLGGRVYEMFRFVRGVTFDRSPRHTMSAGRTLALLHAELRSFHPSWLPPTLAFHAAPHVLRRLAQIPSRLADPQIREVTRWLAAAYEQAAAAAAAVSAMWRPQQLIHADWHPGNLLFSPPPESKVVAVVDFDSVRLAPPVFDLANAALQFSMGRPGVLLRPHPSGTQTEHLPNLIDMPRFRAIASGYHSRVGQGLDQGEVQALPWLMIEALIAEAAIPIAVTGRFGRLDGAALLHFVHHAVHWIQVHVPDLTAAAAESLGSERKDGRP